MLFHDAILTPSALENDYFYKTVLEAIKSLTENGFNLEGFSPLPIFS